jgi:hypothetical protein
LTHKTFAVALAAACLIWRIDQVTGAGYDATPNTSGQLEVYPFPCPTPSCTVSLTVRSSIGIEFATFSYRD